MPTFLVESIASTIMALTTIVGTLFAISRWVHKSLLKPVTAKLEALEKLEQTVKINTELLNSIQYQLSPNGGKSLADTINSIRDDIEHILALRSAELRVTEEPYFLTNKDGEITNASDYLASLLHLNQAELRGMNWVSAIEIGLRASVRAEWSAAIQDKREFNITVPFSKDGESTVVFIKAVPLFSRSHALLGYLGWVHTVAPTTLQQAKQPPPSSQHN